MNGAPEHLADIARYYDKKVHIFGATAVGVDWPSLRSVHARILQLLEVADLRGGGSLNDLGCGWGSALEMIELMPSDAAIDYFGVDVAPGMIHAARARWTQRPRTRFATGSGCPRVADYTIASGIFNVKLSSAREVWEMHVRRTLEDMHGHSAQGFAVNFMLPDERTRGVDELYCTEPDAWIEYCGSISGRPVELRHSTDLAEFTLLIR